MFSHTLCMYNREKTIRLVILFRVPSMEIAHFGMNSLSSFFGGVFFTSVCFGGTSSSVFRFGRLSSPQKHVNSPTHVVAYIPVRNRKSEFCDTSVYIPVHIFLQQGNSCDGSFTFFAAHIYGEDCFVTRLVLWVKHGSRLCWDGTLLCTVLSQSPPRMCVFVIAGFVLSRLFYSVLSFLRQTN